MEVQNQKKLFEDFLVIGVDKDDLRNYSEQHPTYYIVYLAVYPLEIGRRVAE